MSQRLRIRSKKDGSARGVAIRKTNATKGANIADIIGNTDTGTENTTKKPSILSSLFSLAYQQHLEKNGKSKSQTS